MITAAARRPAELAAMRRAGRVAAEVLERLTGVVRPGVTTARLDALAEEWILRRGGRPAFKGYRGFPASICASVNEQVVHGIPGPRVLVDGDIISIDVGVIMDGFYADTATSLAVGRPSPEAQRLLAAGRAALEAGIRAARAGGRVGDIGHAVEQAAARTGYAVVRDYFGHGIGARMHEAPQVPNYGPAGCGAELLPGMTLAIEPMLVAGSAEVAVAGDEWTVVTVDGSTAVHFEHTVAVTDGEAEVLTRPA
ncbi:MAG TPA: type I methionyl aminopeptidase [Bacillota bacterium]